MSSIIPSWQISVDITFDFDLIVSNLLRFLAYFFYKAFLIIIFIQEREGNEKKFARVFVANEVGLKMLAGLCGSSL